MSKVALIDLKLIFSAPLSIIINGTCIQLKRMHWKVKKGAFCESEIKKYCYCYLFTKRFKRHKTIKLCNIKKISIQQGRKAQVIVHTVLLLNASVIHLYLSTLSAFCVTFTPYFFLKTNITVSSEIYDIHRDE